MVALTALNKRTGNGVLQNPVSKMKLENTAVLSPALTTFQRKSCLFPERIKMNSTCCMMANIRILKPHCFSADKTKIDFTMCSLKRLQEPRRKITTTEEKLLSVGCLEKTHCINVRIRKPWVGGNDSSAGSEVTAGGIRGRVHSLVAAPLMRVCPEEFSVDSSRQSSGRGQT